MHFCRVCGAPGTLRLGSTNYLEIGGCSSRAGASNLGRPEPVFEGVTHC
jgi:hypothetical protein